MGSTVPEKKIHDPGDRAPLPSLIAVGLLIALATSVFHFLATKALTSQASPVIVKRTTDMPKSACNLELRTFS
jgi:hypothetical protein